MRYFITGATGFIGGNIARQLIEAGHEVVALARSPEKAKELAQLGAGIAPGDITDKESMREPMRGVDGVFHIAAWYKIGAPDSSMADEINVQGTRNVLQLMQELGVPKGVYTSTLAIFSDTEGKIVDERYHHDGPWLSEYDRTKWVAHYEVALPMIADGLPLVIVQPGMVYGPGDQGPTHNLWQDYLTRRLQASPQRTAYCWGYVEDTARGHVLAMERGKVGESYIIAGPPHSLRYGLEMAERITGVPAPRFHPPPWMLRGAAKLMEPIARMTPLPETLSPEYLRVAAGVTYLGSNAKARRELGFDPRRLERGLPPTLEWEMAQLGMQPPATAAS